MQIIATVARAAETLANHWPTNWTAATLIVFVWLAIADVSGWLLPWQPGLRLLTFRRRSRDQRRRRDFQRIGDPEQALERRLPLASLEHSDKGPVQIRCICQSFLRKVGALAIFTKHFTESGRQ
jgi:hypothetical protein